MRALILAGVLAATPALADTPSAPSGQTAAGRPPLPQSVWAPLADGEVQHVQSGLRCPLTLGGFGQAGVTTYDGFGLDVSCGYTSRTVSITFYLTRGLDLKDAYAQTKAALVDSHEARRPVLKSEGSREQGGLQWLHADYALDGDALRSEIWMTELSGWVLKYRVSYPTRDAAAAAAQLDRLTPLVRASAGERLAVCAKSRPPERAGKAAKPSRGADDVMNAVLGGITAATADLEDKPATPIIFCVEEPLQVKKMDFLVWRGVTPAGEDAQVDRITGMTVGPPPVLDIARDETASLVLAELTGKATQRWTARIVDGRKTLIFGHFDGRPPPKLTGELMSRILSGKARSLGGYDAESKTVSVTTK